MALMGNNIITAVEIWCLVLCLICEFTLFSVENAAQSLKSQKQMVFYNALALLCDGISGIGSGNEWAWVPYILIAANTIAYAASFAFLYWAGTYIGDKLPENRAKAVKRENLVILIAGLALTLQNLYTRTLFYIDDANRYCRGAWFHLWQVFAIAVIGHYLYLIIAYRESLSKRCVVSFVFFITVVVTTVALQMIGVPITLIYIAMTLGTFLIIMNSMLELLSVLLAKEKKLSEDSIDIVKSQIRPHFLYNCLNSIYYLCDDDPEKAKTAISDFSEYLRTDLDSLSGDRIIPFEKELEHVETYLRLEKMRFADELTIVYEIHFTNFKVPSLTLQPLVENAVKHGVSKKPGGGSVIISANRKGNLAIICVEDDGVGFDTRSVMENVPDREPGGRTHVGVDNVQRRVQSLAGGSLTITSERGVGTKAVIELPIEA